MKQHVICNGRIVLQQDVMIPMRDGAHVAANVYLPPSGGPCPVIMTFGPYGKDVHLRNYLPHVWDVLKTKYPAIMETSSCEYLGWETPDPEVWVPHGYAVVKVDSRGSGRSPGYLDVNSPAEYRDFHDAIAWAGGQDWCTGKVGLLGISYFAASQWNVAALQPPHLAAILPWQGTPDFYRDRTRQGGIFGNGFVQRWWGNVVNNQYGNGDSTFVDMLSGQRNTGPETIPPDVLVSTREDYVANIRAHPLLDNWYRDRIPDYSKINVPACVVANWGGLGLHLRGTVEGFTRIASSQKWLKIQAQNYFGTFFLPESVAMQRRFFDTFLKGLEVGWDAEPQVELTVRAPDDTVQRLARGRTYPLETTQWERFYLDAEARSLSAAPPKTASSVSYPAISEGIDFLSAPLDADLEFAGPIKAKLHVACSKPDMDLFATVRAFGPDNQEVAFFAALEPRAPISQGWLRVAQRRLDPVRSTEFWPVHSHDHAEPLRPGEVYEIDVEVWPGSAFLPAGYRLCLTLQGKDFERPGKEGTPRGSGFFLHTDPLDRPLDRYSGEHWIHSGPARPSYLLLPRLNAG